MCFDLFYQILKGKYHGTVDIGFSFLTYKSKHRRIDIDAEDLIYHIKVGRVGAMLFIPGSQANANTSREMDWAG